MRLSFFWVSVIFHLIFIGMVFYFSRIVAPVKIVPKIVKDDQSYYYTPSYAAAAPPTVSSANPQKNPPAKKNDWMKPMDKGDQAFDLSRPVPKPSPRELLKSAAINSPFVPPAPTLSAEQSKLTEPIRMIGEKLLDDPLRKLLGRAFTAQLYYPRVARDLRLRGIVSIGFVLHPNGEITGTYIVKSSRERILDTAALNAINRASPIANVDLYVKEEKYYVINIIF